METLFEIREGDKVRYNFPKAIGKNKNIFFGVVSLLSENYIFIKSEDGNLLKVSFSNFRNIEPVK